MKTRNTRWLALAGFVLLAVTFTAWKKSDTVHSVYQYSPGYEQQDTTPVRKKTYSYTRKNYNANELDEAMQEIDRAMVELDKSLKVDLGKMNKDLKAAMGEIKNINFDKISDDVRSSLKEINWEDSKGEIKRALREAERELKKIDKEKIRVDIDTEKFSESFLGDVIKNSVDIGLKAARIGLNQAKKELQQLKEFTTELENDGLINTKEAFKIQIKDHEMTINGKKQSKQVNEKFNKYFKDGDYTIRSGGEDD